MLIKKSGRTLECLSPNSDVVNLKCFSFEVPFILNQDSKQGQDLLKTPSEWRSFSRCIVIFFQVHSDPLPAIRQGGTKGLKRRSACGGDPVIGRKGPSRRKSPLQVKEPTAVERACME